MELFGSAVSLILFLQFPRTMATVWLVLAAIVFWAA